MSVVATGPFDAGTGRRQRGESSSARWTAAAFAVAGLTALPILAVMAIAAGTADALWADLAGTVLPGLVWRTLWLIVTACTVAFVLGVSTAWLVTLCDVPFARPLSWAMLLPLAMPTYLAAYVYVDMLEFAGPVQTALRDLIGWRRPGDYWFPEVRSLAMAGVTIGFVLYPYVYLTARAAFLQQSVCVLEVGRTLGRTPFGVFTSIALPLARPAIVVGLMLVAMECLNDIGAVEYFGVRTLTVGLYDVWLGRGSLVGGAQIAVVMLVFVAAMVIAERRARGARQYHATTTRTRPLPRYHLGPAGRWIAFGTCALPVLLGFAVPAATLVGYALERSGTVAEAATLAHAGNSLALAASAAGVAVLLGIVLAYAIRLNPARPVRAAAGFAALGYALPGVVLGLGLLIPLAALDNAFDAFFERTIGVSTGLLITGSIAALVLAYAIRFLALAFGNIDAGLKRVTPSMDMAAQSLGASAAERLARVHLPLIRPALLTAGLLVFVDSMKELPATLILRPFNFDTLATQVYTYASLGLVEEAAPAALMIVAAGLLPVIVLTRTIAASRPGHSGRLRA